MDASLHTSIEDSSFISKAYPFYKDRTLSIEESGKKKIVSEEIYTQQMIGLTEWINEVIGVSVDSDLENPLEETRLLIEKSKGFYFVSLNIYI